MGGEGGEGKRKEQSHLGRQRAQFTQHTPGEWGSPTCVPTGLLRGAPTPRVHCALTHPRRTRFPDPALQCLWEPPRHPIWDPGRQTCVCLVRLHGAPTMWMSLRPNHWPQTWAPPWPEQASREPRRAPALAPSPSRLSPPASRVLRLYAELREPECHSEERGGRVTGTPHSLALPAPGHACIKLPL